MIEPYQWLLKQCKELGYKEENIGPASVDLCLADLKFYYTDDKEFRKRYPVDTTYYLYPSIFYLASTEEYIKVPSTHCAFINMRSSLARKGLGHKMAGFIDPGFEGEITLELTTDVPLEIKRGERVVQLIYCRLSEETLKPYTGKYLKQVGATEAYKTL